MHIDDGGVTAGDQSESYCLDITDRAHTGVDEGEKNRWEAKYKRECQ